MNHTDNQLTGSTPTGKLSDEQKGLIDRLIGQSEYNPYRKWLIGHPNEQEKLPVYQIKAASDLAVLAAPTLGLLVKGSDYLETQRTFAKALLAELGKPSETIVAVTCTAPFDHNGQLSIRQEIASTPADTPNPAPATTQTTTQTTTAEVDAPTNDQPQESSVNLFAGVDEYLEPEDAHDPNNSDQLGLF